MLFPYTLLVILSFVPQSLQLGIDTEMTSATYKKIEVEEKSWREASQNETKTYSMDNMKG